MCPKRTVESPLPHLSVNMAMTMDGKVTRPDGSWHGLTSSADRARMQMYRNQADYLILGYKSLNKDDPEFEASSQGFPIPIILARSGLPDLHLKVFHTPHIPRPILVVAKESYGIQGDAKDFETLSESISNEGILALSKKAHIFFWKKEDIEPRNILKWIASQGGRSALLEGGPTLNYPFFAEDLVNSLHVTIVPYLIGLDGLPGVIKGLRPFPDFDEARWRLEACEVEGNEVFLTWERITESEAPERLKALVESEKPISLSSHKESQRQLFMKQVLARSARIFRDKRELTTAVEFLNYANDELEKKIEESEKELKIARNIQLGLFPQIIPNWEGLRFWAYNKEMAGVSGDFYDYFDLGKNGLGLVVADVCGHGVPAALISALAKVSFTNYASLPPKEVLQNVNLDLIKYVKMEGYLTATFLRFDDANCLRYSVGGMPAPLLYRANTKEVEELPSDGALLGMFPDAGNHLHEYRSTMQEGDKLFIYTDGISEATNAKGELLGIEGLSRLILETEKMDCEESGRHIIEKVNKFSLGQSATDDVTLVVVELSPLIKIYETYCKKARNLFQQGDVEEAIEELRKALHIFPNKPETLYSLSKILLEQGRYIEAGELADRLLKLIPDHIGALVCRALAAEKRGLRPLAESSFKQALAIDPDHPLALYQITKYYLRKKDAQKAQKYFAQLLSLQGESKGIQKLRRELELIS